MHKLRIIAYLRERKGVAGRDGKVRGDGYFSMVNERVRDQKSDKREEEKERREMQQESVPQKSDKPVSP